MELGLSACKNLNSNITKSQKTPKNEPLDIENNNEEMEDSYDKNLSSIGSNTLSSRETTDIFTPKSIDVSLRKKNKINAKNEIAQDNVTSFHEKKRVTLEMKTCKVKLSQLDSAKLSQDKIKLLNCDYCEKVFKTKESLKDHNSSDHVRQHQS